jgi:hypothetical protein
MTIKKKKPTELGLRVLDTLGQIGRLIVKVKAGQIYT